MLFSAGPFVTINYCQWLLFVVPLPPSVERSMASHEDATLKYEWSVSVAQSSDGNLLGLMESHTIRLKMCLSSPKL